MVRRPASKWITIRASASRSTTGSWSSINRRRLPSPADRRAVCPAAAPASKPRLARLRSAGKPFEVSEKVRLAHRHAAVPQDVVRGGEVKEEVGQCEMREIALSVEAHRAATQLERNLTRLSPSEPAG